MTTLLSPIGLQYTIHHCLMHPMIVSEALLLIVMWGNSSSTTSAVLPWQQRREVEALWPFTISGLRIPSPLSGWLLLYSLIVVLLPVD